ncbi:dehydrogenase/reductase SDR family protein 7-like [Hyalella azteca]|uniref:Dehydrogenase/reductase SDR family protein 7-like n=1 Tax=Hyalella azteca TaxID=294128 RepID=A0A979FTT1_HYAAZ|nr:dehydrogenase/reductase SDR family protein 7-like [Hyalella azteca]
MTDSYNSKPKCYYECSGSTESGVVFKEGHTPSILHSLPWLLGWVWLSIVGPVLAVKLFASVARALFVKYLWRGKSLNGKVVLITGASSGVGAAVAKLLYCQGCRLILASRSVDKLHALKQELIASCQTPVVHEPIVMQLDITDLTAVDDLMVCCVQTPVVHEPIVMQLDITDLTAVDDPMICCVQTPVVHEPIVMQLDITDLTAVSGAVDDPMICCVQTPVVHEPIVMQLDITDLTAVPDAVEAVVQRVGAVDVLINNAGQSFRGAAAHTLLDVDLKLMLVNYFGHVALTKGGLWLSCVVLVCLMCLMAVLGGLCRSSYCASKHALQGFMDSLRPELACHNIAVSVISPAYINTNLSINAITATGGTYGGNVVI